MRHLLLALILGLASFVTAQDVPQERIMFAYKDSITETRLYSMNPDGTDTQQIATDPEGIGLSYGAALSPDGQKLVYVRTNCINDNCGSALNLLNMETGAISELTHGIRDGLVIKWSPNGQYVAYYNRDTFPYMAIVEASTGNIVLNVGEDFLRAVDNENVGYLMGFDWASDSQHLVLSINHQPEGSQLYVLALNGQIESIGGDVGGMNPDWQPESEMIYFQCASLADICRMNLTTQEWEIIPEFATQLQQINPDVRYSLEDVDINGNLLLIARYLLTGSRGNKIYNIYTYDTNTNTLTQVTQNTDVKVWYHFAYWHTPQVAPVASATSTPTR